MPEDNVQAGRKRRSGKVDALMTGKGADSVRSLRQGATRIGNVADAPLAGDACPFWRIRAANRGTSPSPRTRS